MRFMVVSRDPMSREIYFSGTLDECDAYVTETWPTGLNQFPADDSGMVYSETAYRRRLEKIERREK